MPSATSHTSGERRHKTRYRVEGKHSHRWLCSGRGCLLTDWSPWGRRPGPLSPRAARAHLAARILWEEQSWEPESWRSQLAPSAPGTRRHHMSSCQHTVFYRKYLFYVSFLGDHLAGRGRGRSWGLLTVLLRISWTGVRGWTSAPGKQKNPH